MRYARRATARTGELIETYRCGKCKAWHIGHTRQLVDGTHVEIKLDEAALAALRLEIEAYPTDKLPRLKTAEERRARANAERQAAMKRRKAKQLAHKLKLRAQEEANRQRLVQARSEDCFPSTGLT